MSQVPCQASVKGIPSYASGRPSSVEEISYTQLFKSKCLKREENDMNWEHRGKSDPCRYGGRIIRAGVVRVSLKVGVVQWSGCRMAFWAKSQYVKRPQTASHMKGTPESLLGDWSVGGDRKGQEKREPENRSGQGQGVDTKEFRCSPGRGEYCRCGTYLPNVVFIRILTP